MIAKELDPHLPFEYRVRDLFGKYRVRDFALKGRGFSRAATAPD